MNLFSDSQVQWVCMAAVACAYLIAQGLAARGK